MKRAQDNNFLIWLIVALVVAGLVILFNTGAFDKFGSIFASYQPLDTRVATCDGLATQDVLKVSYCDVNTDKAVQVNEQAQYVSCLYLASSEVNKADKAIFDCPVIDVKAQAKTTCDSLVKAKKITTQRKADTTFVNGLSCGKDLAVIVA